MSASNLVIVESPAKAKTIEKYLGGDYHVLASFGHIRDLPPKDGSVLPDEDFAMQWQLGDRAGKPIAEIKKALKNAETLWLATDPDREGEAISWHVQEYLNENNLLKGKTIRRVTFNEITKTAVRKAFDEARELDTPLVEAYLARRALDYLVGFTLSPVLWRKLPGSKSAGRVQSVALRAICEREAEIEVFKPQEYWSIEARLHNAEGAPYTARLTHLAGNKLDKLDIQNEEQAKSAVNRIQQKSLKIQKIEKKQVRRNPSPPFITSTLQQEAARKLYFGAQKTMRTAQRLYEGVNIKGEQTGLITYMRTDGTTLSQEAVNQARAEIKKGYGEKYVPDAPRLFKSKAKNAQEAHEAIRPTDLSRSPADVAKFVDEDMAKLYRLIWLRTMASQMEQAVMDQVSADISDGTDDVVMRATGSSVVFDGFLAVYEESVDDDKVDERDRRLPPLSEGEGAKVVDVTPEQHFTQPPPRYSEASLVKKLEELGIGRPSTYASILQVLQDRNYVVLDKRRFIPEDRGRVVTEFLKKYFHRYVDYDFTANLEEELDAIAAGHVFWKEALRQFWTSFSKAVGDTKDLTITEVLDHLDEELGPHFFPNEGDRKCPSCNEGRLSLKLGKFGAFIGCSNYPDCRYTRPLALQDEETAAEDKAAAALANEPKILGEDPATGRTVSLRSGPYGPYVQIDAAEQADKSEEQYNQEIKDWEAAKKVAKAEGKKAPKKPSKPKAPKPKRQGLLKGTKPEDVTLESALKLLAFPRDVGEHPETGKMIKAGIGRFGPYLVHDNQFTSIKNDDPAEIGLNRAVVVIAEAAEKKKNAPARTSTAKKKAAPKKKTASKKKSTTTRKKTAGSKS
jgi:DNA topoisomerase I